MRSFVFLSLWGPGSGKMLAIALMKSAGQVASGRGGGFSPTFVIRNLARYPSKDSMTTSGTQPSASVGGGIVAQRQDARFHQEDARHCHGPPTELLATEPRARAVHGMLGWIICGHAWLDHCAAPRIDRRARRGLSRVFVLGRDLYEGGKEIRPDRQFNLKPTNHVTAYSAVWPTSG